MRPKLKTACHGERSRTMAQLSNEPISKNLTNPINPGSAPPSGAEVHPEAFRELP